MPELAVDGPDAIVLVESYAGLRHPLPGSRSQRNDPAPFQETLFCSAAWSDSGQFQGRAGT
jgi:hypothetical protein